MIWLVIWLWTLLAVSLVFNYIQYLENREHLSRLKLIDHLQSEALYNKWNSKDVKNKGTLKKKKTKI